MCVCVGSTAVVLNCDSKYFHNANQSIVKVQFIGNNGDICMGENKPWLM